MHRFFVENIIDGRAEIAGEDLHHLSRVLRLNSGDEISLCDGRGTDYDRLIENVSAQAALVRAENPRPSLGEPAVSVTLFQGLPKGSKFELIVQKCVELGVYSIVPVMMRRCVAEPTKDFEKKRQRYQRIADEAAKQAKRGVLPKIGSCAPLEKCDFPGYDIVLVAYEDEKQTSLKQALRAHGAFKSAAIIIGPEGGFEKDEIEKLAARGAVPVSLGNSILRTETAGLAMLSNVLYEVGE